MKDEPPLTTLPFRVGVSSVLKIRGLIAQKEIKKGRIIERCPVVLVGKEEESALKQTVLWKYYYEWDNEYHAIVLGYGSLINHSYTPNARYVFDYKNKLFIVKAIKNIKKDEEITVNYNYCPNSRKPVDPDLTDFNRHLPVLEKSEGLFKNK